MQVGGAALIYHPPSERAARRRRSPTLLAGLWRQPRHCPCCQLRHVKRFLIKLPHHVHKRNRAAPLRGWPTERLRRRPPSAASWSPTNVAETLSFARLTSHAISSSCKACYSVFSDGASLLLHLRAARHSFKQPASHPAAPIGLQGRRIIAEHAARSSRLAAPHGPAPAARRAAGS